jgi:CHAT domain-containing protein/Tfp pilus assembly protein PilF
MRAVKYWHEFWAVVRVFACVFIVCFAAELAFASPLDVQSAQSAASAARPQEIVPLALDKPIEVQLSGGEKRSYRIHAEAGQFIHAVATQEGIHAALKFLDPTGKQIAQVDMQNGCFGPETISAIAESAGDLRLDVISTDKDAVAGKYQLQLTDLRAPAEADRTRVAAKHTYMEGVALAAKPDADSYKAAAAKWEESFRLWQSLDAKYEEGLSLVSAGSIYSALGNAQKALDDYNQSLPLFRAAGDRGSQAITLNNIGLLVSALGDKQKALDSYNLALPLEREIHDRLSEAATLNNIGLANFELGEKQKAADYFNQALPIERELADRVGEATTYTNLGSVYAALGDNAKALESFNQAMPLLESTGNQAGEVTALGGLASIYNASGQKQKALDYLNRIVPLLQATGDQALLAKVLNDIGGVYYDLEDKQKALEFYNQALPLRRAAKDRDGEAIALSNIGLAYSDLGDKQKALENFNLALPIELEVQDREGQATTLSNLGEVYSALGQQQKALDDFNQALQIELALKNQDGEAIDFNKIGLVYSDIGEHQKALDYLNRALVLRRATGNRGGEAITLGNIGLVYSTIGDQQKALEFDNQSLALARAVGDRSGEASVLNNMGKVYSDLGQPQKALDSYNLALPLLRAIGDRGGEARTLNNVGMTYYVLGRNQDALEQYARALALLRATGDRIGEAAALNDIGAVCLVLGEAQKALDYFTKALPLQRDTQDRAGEARSLSNMGAVYSSLGQQQKALDNYTQALALRRAVGDKVGEGVSLNNIGISYFALGDNAKALDYFNLALPLQRDDGNQAGEALTLANRGAIYSGRGENSKALEDYTQSLLLFRTVQDPLGEADTLLQLMEYWKKLKNDSLAILFGKQAIDRFQLMRRNIEGLEKEAQKSFLKSKEYYYRDLADLLIGDGRLPEAQQLLDLLKVEEYSEFTQRRGDAGSATSSVSLTAAEQKTNAQYDQLAGEITAIGQQWSELRAKSSRTPGEQKQYDDLSDKLTAANRQMQTYFNSLYESFGKGAQANTLVENIKEQTGELKTLAGNLGAGTVALYTLVLDDKCVIMVITPATRVAREVQIKRLALRTKVFAFAAALAGHQPDDVVQAKAADLYQILVAPVEKDLEGAQAQTLIWSLDDVLRYVPVAALYDGKHYLVERYRNAVITTASIGNLKDQPNVSNWSGLAMGVSKDYDGLGALKAVPGELDSVVHSDATTGSHGPVAGTIMLDDSFTEKSMESGLERHPSLVHIASHYVFHPGEDTNSFLLLGGKDSGGSGFHLTLADLRDDERMDFSGIELLTLSGCQTAVGSNDSDGREVDGLGIVAQQKGAKSVVATLWPVDDASVGKLMATFYKLWITTPGMSKSEALRQAQLSLLHGDAGGAASSYASPYYWAPFILIGNWK